MQRAAIQRVASTRASLAYSRHLANGGRRRQTSGSNPRSSGPSFITYVGIGLGFSAGLGGLAYAYYHFSGLKAMVDRVLRVKAKVEQVKTAYIDQRPKTMGEAVAFLRSISKSQQGPVPDAFVDVVAQYQGAHDEDIDHIVFGACDDIRSVLAHTSAVENGVVVQASLPKEDRERIVDAVQRRAGELRRRLRERRKEAAEEESEGDTEEDGERRGVMARIRARRAAKGQQRAEEDSDDQ